jgi:hypothetical protein
MFIHVDLRVSTVNSSADSTLFLSGTIGGNSGERIPRMGLIMDRIRFRLWNREGRFRQSVALLRRELGHHPTFEFAIRIAFGAQFASSFLTSMQSL